LAVMPIDIAMWLTATIPYCVDTFDLRPHAGLGQNQNQLAAAFLLADSINNGAQLAKSPVMQYLYGSLLVGHAHAVVGH
jgi:hypothetical protein